MEVKMTATEIEKIAVRIVDNIIEEMCDRRGLGNEWENFDEEIQDEIRTAWMDIVIEELYD
jgi:hypothetical protein